MPLGPRFDDALLLAHHWHRDQQRKVSGIPYISHLLAVAAIVLDHGGDEDEAIAALLHDAIEDQGGPQARAEILRRFGPRVTEIVDGCTDTDEVPKPPWRPRKEAYIAHLQHACPSNRLVSAADKLHNARSILQDYRQHGEAVWSRFAGGRDGMLWYLRAVTNALAAGGSLSVVDELERTVSELERLAG